MVSECSAVVRPQPVDLKALGAPFSVVLFDAADFRALGGAAFRGTWFFRNMTE